MQAHAGLILIVVQKGAANRDCGACKMNHFASVMAGSLYDGLLNTLPGVFMGLQRCLKVLITYLGWPRCS